MNHGDRWMNNSDGWMNGGGMWLLTAIGIAVVILLVVMIAKKSK